MLAKSAERVSIHTSDDKNLEIRRETEFSIGHYAALGPEAIEHRLEELDAEWDIERVIEINAATLILMGTVLGLQDKRWIALSAAVSVLLLMHALEGWCPPVPLLRSLGFRTEREIDRERYALKAIRGDFENMKQVGKSVRQPVNRIYDAAA